MQRGTGGRANAGQNTRRSEQDERQTNAGQTQDGLVSERVDCGARRRLNARRSGGDECVKRGKRKEDRREKKESEKIRPEMQRDRCKMAEQQDGAE
jgi:hypothetical protein